jgi:integrase
VVFTREEVRRILENLDGTYKLIAGLLYGSGLRLMDGEVYLPYALERKYPNAAREWAWQYVFPAAN